MIKNFAGEALPFQQLQANIQGYRTKKEYSYFRRNK
jgi:hypothetical protein